MAKDFKWTKELMRRARDEFHCIECDFDKHPDEVSFFHKHNCQKGLGLDFDTRSDRISVWGFWLEEIIEAEKDEIVKVKCKKCSDYSTGSIYLLYHDGSLLLHYPACDKHSFDEPEDMCNGRSWGFAPNVISSIYEDYKILEFLDRI